MGSDVALDKVGKARRDHQDDAETEQNRQQRLRGMAEDAADAFEPRGITDRLQRPDEGEKACTIGPQQRIENGRQHAQEIEETARRDGPGEPRPQRSAVLGPGGAAGSDEAQPVFGAEEGADGGKPCCDERVMSPPPGGHAIGEQDRDPGNDHRVVDAAEDSSGAVLGLGLKDPVEPCRGHVPF